MRTDAGPNVTRLKDYAPPSFRIEQTHLTFELDPSRTIVKAHYVVKRVSAGPLILDGEDITLKMIAVNGQTLKRSQYKLDQSKLILSGLPDEFTLDIKTEINPSANSTLMGLYVSGGRFCTQCEAEGFRRITFYLDRPDAMSVFTVRIEAEKTKYPYLLANGNKIAEGDLEDGRHYAIWHDPFPKPCYLFALVAGEFDLLQDEFITVSDRKIPLTIYVDPGDAGRAEYAMDALKRAMKWDEEAYGREYDLDRFMIVAVRDFNFGAMENKGLNIFNSALLLADAETATDLNFERIESVVAHEYFHNWTGNRITCRDWFQLCLKEGFTVFRDQEFSASERGFAVQRIKDVRALRSRQFPEDAGPLAHPVRPSEYIKIDNFYTSTIYEKGAELIRMLKTWLGDDIFRQGCDYYFNQLDGTAATVEEFIACFAKVSGKDLSPFMVWYHEAGTPVVEMRITRNSENMIVHFSQNNPPTPGQAQKSAKLIPVKWQIVHDNGKASQQRIDVLGETPLQIKCGANIDTPGTPSVLQDFSAPVILKSNLETSDFLRLMANDKNPFNRWESGQTIARKLLGTFARSLQANSEPAPDRALQFYVNALKSTLLSSEFDPAFKALTLTPPSEAEILQFAGPIDPVAVSLSRDWLLRAIGDGLRDDLLSSYHALTDDGPFSPSAEAAGKRALQNRCLALLAARQDPEAAHLAVQQFENAQNMTNEAAALGILMQLGGRRVDQSLENFYQKWQNNPLVIDKWFSIVAGRKSKNPVKHVNSLLAHPAYDPRNPNRVRALVGGFAMTNSEGFHHISGQGYAFLRRQVLDMDQRNPQIAARLLGVFEIWRKLDPARQALIRAELKSVLDANPSKNVLEIGTKTLG